jgi:hypothetical protein
LAHYIKDVNSFLSDFGTTSAAYALPVSDPVSPGEAMSNLKTVKQGMNEIPKRLLSKFRHGNHRYQITACMHAKLFSSEFLFSKGGIFRNVFLQPNQSFA